MLEYSKEQLLKLYKNLPKDLQEALYSEENTRVLREICLKNQVLDEDIVFKITKNLGYIFLGLLLPSEFQNVLEKELSLEKAKAKQISLEISRFIFLPIRNSLEALYKIKISPELKPKISSLPSKAVSKRKAKKEDKYREPFK